MYITNVAVKNKYRRKGVAVGLLSELIDLAKEADSEFVSLEVRCSNTPAISLYGKLGFGKIGIRKNFYENPREDAVDNEQNIYKKQLNVSLFNGMWWFNVNSRNRKLLRRNLRLPL